MLSLVFVTPVQAAPGDHWILPIDHLDGGFFVWPAAGYGGSDAYEFFTQNPTPADPFHRVWWALNGLSLNTSNAFPTTTELYTIEWFEPTTGPTDWQPIESQFHGTAGETFPYDPSIPWAGEYGTSHQYIGAQGTGNNTGTFLTTGPGPHTPESSAYNCLGDSGIFMWLTRGSYLYAKWDFTFPIDHTWSALRLTQVTPVTFLSITNSSHNIYLTWSTIPNYTYQVQYATNVAHPTWNNVGGIVTAGGYTASATDSSPPDADRFYRVVENVP